MTQNTFAIQLAGDSEKLDAFIAAIGSSIVLEVARTGVTGVELAFETMTSSGIIAESAYYESLHEVPLIANLIGRKKLYEMNKVISDTAEYGCYLFAHECVPLLKDFMQDIDIDVIGQGLQLPDNGVDNAELIAVNEKIRNHPVEVVGMKLRSHMTAMKKVI